MCNKCVCLIYLFYSLLCKQSSAIQCYQCNSSLECTEFFVATTDLMPMDCNHLHDAAYCIKMTGISGGDLGTKRFCSSRSWGNYCEYYKRPGDTLEQRSCVYTCSTDACNRGHRISLATLFFLLLPITFILIRI